MRENIRGRAIAQGHGSPAEGDRLGVPVILEIDAKFNVQQVHSSRMELVGAGYGRI